MLDVLIIARGILIWWLSFDEQDLIPLVAVSLEQSGAALHSLYLYSLPFDVVHECQFKSLQSLTKVDKSEDSVFHGNPYTSRSYMYLDPFAGIN